MKTLALLGVGFLAVRACSLVTHQSQPVEISARVADGQLQLAYRVPKGLQRLHWLDNARRVVQLVREPMLKAVDDCGRIEGEELVISDAPSCAQTARFAVQPKVLGQNGFNEAVQPTSDGGVVMYTRYFAVAATGYGLRWRFEPPPGGYVAVDATGAGSGTRSFEVQAADVERALRSLDNESAWRTLLASHTVYLGRASSP